MAWTDFLEKTDEAALSILGSNVTYSSGSSSTTVRGIFERQHSRSVDPDAAGVISGGVDGGPAVFLRLSDLPTDPESDANASVIVGGVVYTVRKAIKDGHGGVLCLLNEED